MSKYVDAEKLCDGRVSNDPVVIAAKCAPEEDVAPVVHAHWILDDEKHCFNCSNCKDIDIQKTPFCKWCGAKMDEES